MRDTSTEAINRRAADTVRTLRERRGMSQDALAAEMSAKGIQWMQQTVGRIEAGRQAIRLAELVALAAVFGVPLERFTWASGEANAVDWLDMAAQRLQAQAAETARAVAAQIAAGSLAEQALEGTAKYDAPRVTEARQILEDAIEEYGPVEAAVYAGCQMYQSMHDGEEGEGDGGNAESEPELVDQRQAQ